jgi:hypothetical protein
MYQDDYYYKKYFQNYNPTKYPYQSWTHYFQGLLPGLGLNYSIFMITVQIMANDD